MDLVLNESQSLETFREFTRNDAAVNHAHDDKQSRYTTSLTQ